MEKLPLLDRAYAFFFSDQRRTLFERIILSTAVVGFLIHLVWIYLIDFGWIQMEQVPALLKNPIAAAYTPFSFILVYEVYLLVYYLPRSITTYISKQYEIITLIMIRRLFKDLASVEISPHWFEIQGDLQFTYDLVGSLLLFYLLYLFRQQGMRRRELAAASQDPAHSLEQFIRLKKAIAVCLIPILFLVASYTFITWSIGAIFPDQSIGTSFDNINHVFFDEFFGILIIVDVLLLLFSFFITDDFHKIIRNSGFIVSTILIRLSFSVEGLVSVALVVASVVFGLLILLIFNQYQKAQFPAQNTTGFQG
ncbi:MAG: hypothetical protein AAF649_08155 [Verrucomicrobiota bacterium]